MIFISMMFHFVRHEKTNVMSMFCVCVSTRSAINTAQIQSLQHLKFFFLISKKTNKKSMVRTFFFMLVSQWTAAK